MTDPEYAPAEQPIRAGDIRLLSKRELQDRVRELLAAEELHVAEIERMRAEIIDLRCSVIAFGGPAIAEYAQERGLPKGHLYSLHYDILTGGRYMSSDDERRIEYRSSAVANTVINNIGNVPDASRILDAVIRKLLVAQQEMERGERRG